MKLFTNNPSSHWGSSKTSLWRYIDFEHPANFETLAMDPKKKEQILNDLAAFSNGKDYYKKIGKAWKRGYLLYGPPGTGKSTMIAAMANLLNYSIYDIELTAIQTNSELKKLLTATSNKSIIVFEDIDCSLDLTGKRKKKESNLMIWRNDGEQGDEENKSSVTLSGLLNFIDGIWSACGQERIIVFTTNHLAKLDPALIRRGRMDMHIELSYCTFEAFKILAKNYLDIDSHPLFKTIESLLKDTEIAPADVAENLMKKNREIDAEGSLKDLIQSLERRKKVQRAPLDGHNKDSYKIVKAFHPCFRTIMEIFKKAETVRLRSYHDKYLLAEEDEESVSQDRDGRSMNARWTVEIVEVTNVIRLKSCFGKYLTASNIPMFLGMTGKKVTQTLPRRLDSSTEWEPVREGVQVRLKTRYGQYLRANGGLPPWRNSITHDIPHRSTTQDWVLWDVDILESRKKKAPPVAEPAYTPLPPPPPPPELLQERKDDHQEPKSPKGFSLRSPRFSKSESDDSVSSPVKADGRLIYYRIGDEDGNVDETTKEELFCFKGMGLEELKEKLKEETGLSDISICSKNPLNGKLYPLRLHLPPNNTKMHVVLIPSPSKGDAASTS
ncbi:hypothetical protein ISN45_Aa05g007260 [Arabidopsis thaliana x Arabidopsis arenosa]|uniref:AAA+ ATPase domain-containing protein n=1 Tax=Arabidopsis thaliana x Arabidopsis arenosa TaxID=1240361 RepID=A0A8T1ZI48_9BRAS|nr:hypothetical protein ISN45_Aa05g007260 [Arabidopsis thaliana x Arabidopsis arenosa]